MQEMQAPEFNFAKAILTEKKPDLSLKEGWVHLTYENGKYGNVKYTYAEKSQKTIDAELLAEEKREVEESLNYKMAEIIIKMDIRREKYRIQDLIDYGYDKYTEEFYYEPETSDDER